MDLYKFNLIEIKKVIQKKFVLDTIYNLIALTIVLIIGITINVILGNYYENSGLGKYTFAIAVYNIATVITTLSIKSTATKFISENSQDKYKQDKSISQIIFFTVLLITVTILLLILLMYLSRFIFYDKVYVLSILFALPFFILNESLMGIYNGLREMKNYAIVRSFRWIFAFSSIIIFAIQKLSIDKILLSFLFAEFLLSIFVLLDQIMRLKIKFKIMPINNIYNLINYGKASMLKELFGQIDNKISIFILSIFFADSIIGIYGYMYSLASGLIFIPSIVGMNFNPIIASLWNSERNKLKLYISKVKKYSALVTLSMAILIGASYPLFVKITMRNMVYLNYLPHFYIILLGSLLFALISPFSGFLQMIGKPEKHMYIRIFSVTINAIMSYILISKFGLFGAALSVLFNNMIFFVLLNTVIKKEINAGQN